MNIAIIFAGGTGQRMGNKDIPKQVFLEMERIKKDIDSLRVLVDQDNCPFS